MQKAVAMDPGHGRVDLCDHQIGVLDGRLYDVDADAEVHIAVIVGKRGLYERHIDLDQLAMNEVRNLGKEDGGIIGKPRIYGVARILTHKKRIMPEVGLEFLVRVRGDTMSDVDYLGVEKGRLGCRILTKGIDQVLAHRSRCR